MDIFISSQTKAKLLKKHGVTEKEVIECLHNRDREALIDDREDHKTDPPTVWIISMTNHLRKLKLVFMVKDGRVVVKSAYEPNPEEVWIYKTTARYLFELGLSG